MHSVLTGEAWSSIAGKINGMLLTCRYNDDFARHVVARLNQAMKSQHGSCCDGCKGFGVFFEKFMKVLLSQKNPSFREEHEERFILMGFPRDKVEIIKGKPRIVVKGSSITKAISCVHMSPHGDSERDRLLVEMLRDKYGLKFPIVKSNSSFNGR